jgi:hypothetical protein
MEHPEYQQRQKEFGAEYEDFEGADIVSLVARTAGWLQALLMDEPAVDAAMRALHAHLFRARASEHDDLTWRELWEGTSVNDQTEVRGAQFLVGLNAFAFYGLRPDTEFFGLGADDVVFAVEAYVGKGRDLLDAIPAGWGDVSDVRRTVLAAEARLRLDTGRDVTPEQLAALARISLKSIKNMLTPKAGARTELRLNEAGEIPGAEALRWLAARDDFKSSLWRSPEAAAVAAGKSGDDAEDVGEVVFVPVAKDGSWFDPLTCRGPSGYAIGPKYSEERVADYREALERLSRMRTPYWRRPNQAGNWGLVAGVSWERRIVRDMAAAELESA